MSRMSTSVRRLAFLLFLSGTPSLLSFVVVRACCTTTAFLHVPLLSSRLVGTLTVLSAPSAAGAGHRSERAGTRANTQPYVSGYSHSSFRFPLLLFLCVANPHPHSHRTAPLPFPPFSLFLSLPYSIHLLLPSSSSFTTTTTTTHVPIQAPARCFAAALPPPHSLMTRMCVLLHFFFCPPPCLGHAYVRMDVVAGCAAPLSPSFVCVCARALLLRGAHCWVHLSASWTKSGGAVPPPTVSEPPAFRRFAFFYLNGGERVGRGLVWLCVYDLRCFALAFPHHRRVGAASLAPFLTPSPLPLSLDEVVRSASWRVRACHVLFEQTR